jgi:hypothetical protein
MTAPPTQHTPHRDIPPKSLSLTSAMAGRGHSPPHGCRGWQNGGGAAAARAQGRRQRGGPGAGRPAEQGWARGIRALWCLGLLLGRLACWSRAESLPPGMRRLATTRSRIRQRACTAPSHAPPRASRRARDEPTRPVPPGPSRLNLLLAPQQCRQPLSPPQHSRALQEPSRH